MHFLDKLSSLGFFGWLEIAAMIVGVIYVLLQIRKTRKMWYCCIVCSILNIFVYAHNAYWAMMLIQFYYIAASFYGISKWTKARADAISKYGYEDRKHRVSIAVCPMDRRIVAVSSAVALACFLVLSLISWRAIPSEAVSFPAKPYLDNAIAVLSMLATYWLSRSYREQWYIWLVVNVAGTITFAYSGMVWMAALYFAYIIMAVVGLIQWTRHGVIANDNR